MGKSRRLPENARLLKLFGIPKKIMLAGSEDSDIKHMTVHIFLRFLDFEQVSVDSEMPILGQAPSAAEVCGVFHPPFGCFFRAGESKVKIFRN